MMRITCRQCGQALDGLLEYENHRRAEDRPLPPIDDWHAIAPARPQDAQPQPEWVRRAIAGQLPASDRTAGR